MSKPVAILGAGGHAMVVKEALELTGRQVIECWEHDEEMRRAVEHMNVGSFEIALGMGRRSLRRACAEKFGPSWLWATVIHPSAIVSKSAIIEPGAQIMAGAIIQAGVVIGRHAIINTGAQVDHGCQIGEFAHVCPGAVLCADVVIGPGAMVDPGRVMSRGYKLYATPEPHEIELPDSPRYADRLSEMRLAQ